MKSILKKLTSCFVAFTFLLVTYTSIEVMADNPPTTISTVEELMAIEENLSGNYILANDIDLTGHLSEHGWKAIGTFKGTFDGDGHTISGLWGKGGSYKGLFSIIDNAVIKNLNIVLADEGLSGGYEIGAVAGTAKNASVIDNITVSGGTIKVTGGGYAGGIVGHFDGRGGTISNVTVYDTKTYTSGNYSGGIVGFAHKTSIENAHALNTTSEADIYAGGLAGGAYNCQISNSTTVAEVSTRAAYAGGFAGAIYGQTSIMDCTADGDAVKSGASYCGGFLGTMYEKSSIERCFTTVKEVRAGGEYAGGFAGEINSGTVAYACATGDVYANNIVGGFTGIAYAGAKLSQINVMGNVESKVSYSGGLAGKLHGRSTLEQASAYGNVSSKSYIAGGLVGEVAGNSTISNTYARGDVSGTTGVGGLVGYFSGSGKVEKHTVYNSYSTGNVSGKSGSIEVGAFSGHSGVTFLGSNYYNSDTAGIDIANGSAGQPQGTFPVGLTTAELMDRDIFADWDFDDIWVIDEGSTYPYFDFCGFTPEVGRPIPER